MYSCKELLAGVGVILKSMTIEDQEPEVVNELESGLEVVTELVSLQEEISSRPKKIVELPIETLVDLPTSLLWS